MSFRLLNKFIKFGTSCVLIVPFVFFAVRFAMAFVGHVKKAVGGGTCGFIKPSDGGADVFAHVNENPALAALQQGQAVTFDKEWYTRKGMWTATNVKGLDVWVQEWEEQREMLKARVRSLSFEAVERQELLDRLNSELLESSSSSSVF